MLQKKTTSVTLLIVVVLIVAITHYTIYNSKEVVQVNNSRAFATDIEEDHRMLNMSNEKVRQLPKCIIIGVRKGGTLALLRLLDIHPDIVIPKDNELRFFSNDKNYMQGLPFYRKLMPISRRNQMPIEKTPQYFHEWKVPRRIFQMNNSIRLLLVVRNPVRRIISEYAMAKFFLHRGKYPELKTLLLDRHGNINQDYIAVNISTYHAHFSNWLKFFPRQQIHIVDGDRFAKHPHEELYSIENFLGIRHVISHKNLVFSKDKGYFCPLGKNNKTVCLPPGKGRVHPEVERAIMDKMKNYFEPLNELFFAMSGRRFEWT